MAGLIRRHLIGDTTDHLQLVLPIEARRRLHLLTDQLPALLVPLLWHLRLRGPPHGDQEEAVRINPLRLPAPIEAQAPPGRADQLIAAPPLHPAGGINMPSDILHRIDIFLNHHSEWFVGAMMFIYGWMLGRKETTPDKYDDFLNE